MAQRHPSGEIDALTAAVADSPRAPDAHFRLAEALRRLRHYGAAEVHYHRAVALDSSHARAYTGLGKLYGDQGNRTKALAALQRALAIGDEASTHYYLGNFYAGQGSYQQAIFHYRQAIEHQPSHEQSYINLAGVYARQTEYSTAIQALTRGVAALPGSAELKFRLGWNYFVQGRYAAALEQFQQVVRLDPQRLQAYDFIARMYMAEEKGEEAQQLLQQALAAHPNASALLARLGILLLDAGSPAQASEYLERAIREAPDHAEAYYGLGQAYLRTGLSARGHAVLHYFELLQDNYQQLLDLKTAIVLNPSDAAAYFGLERCMGASGATKRPAKRIWPFCRSTPAISTPKTTWAICICASSAHTKPLRFSAPCYRPIQPTCAPTTTSAMPIWPSTSLSEPSKPIRKRLRWTPNTLRRTPV